ncbi:chondroitin AC/alginate lyase [Absidia repens]|uniref:Chondroitin AC/alginate lyase n=1 Tax=Absidia repens TaxID=90262 RepID=A0A1X2HZN5_9FUNG|nr:chondroitin AC/alginate lyase [Absidia repens]
MILVLLFLVACIAYYLFIKNYRYLSFGIGCLFFLWYGWYTSYSVFTITHEPIIITSTTSSSATDQSVPQQILKQNNNLLYINPNTTWPININTTQTNIHVNDMQLIIFNKNRGTANSNMDKLSAPVWAQSLNGSGLWSDIDYTSGCSASTIQWPAKMHLERVESMASVWYNQQENDTLLSKITQSLDYWFLHDFAEKDCLTYGGRAYKSCPCGTPGLWNTASDFQVTLIPRYIGNICLLIYKHLSPAQHTHCIKFTSRSYSLINQYDGKHLVNIAYNGVSLALLKNDPILLQDALDHVDNNTVFAPAGMDGLQLDGSYLSHNGQLYNGFDGESYIGDLLTIFDIMALDSKTNWFPSNTTQTAFAVLVSGSEWMMVGRNSSNNSTIPSPWLWQHSARRGGASVSAGNVLLNLTQLDSVIQHWTSNMNTTISPTVRELESTIARLNHTYVSANQGPLIGTRYFWNADYLVHRCHGFVTTLKMVSIRTQAPSECVNGKQNTLLDYYGSMLTYQQGTDYLAIFGGDTAWNWNHIPGTTIRSNTSICNNMDDGNRDKFVGASVLEQSQIGMAVMNHTDTSFGWQKTFSFFPSVYAIQMDMTTTNTSLGTTTLDQRRRRGDLYVNGKRHTKQPPNATHQDVRTLWYDKILYSFETPVNLTMISKGDLWTTFITTSASLVYTVQPNYGSHRHQIKPPLRFITAQGVRGAFSASDFALALAFWEPATINVPWSHSDDGDDGVDVFIETHDPLALVLQQQVGNGTWVASISDPTQTLVSTTIKISVDQEEAPIQYDIDFPQDQMRGSSVMIVLQDEP